MDNGASLYNLIGVTSTSTFSQIKSAYRQKLLHTHPDKVGGNAKIDSIKNAYHILKDPVTRKEYDDSFQRLTKINGFNANGDGLDLVDLDDFKYKDARWLLDCPRCNIVDGIVLSEDDLELGTKDGLGGFNVVVQCESCSLWIKVAYQEEG